MDNKYLKNMKTIILSLISVLFLSLSLTPITDCWLSDFIQSIENGSPEFKLFIKNDLEGASNWRMVYEARGAGSIMKNDLKILNKISDIKNSSAYEVIGGESGLKQIITANRRAPCFTCGDPLVNHLKNMDDYLDDVKHFAENYNIPGSNFEQVLSEIKIVNSNGTANYAMEGASFMLDKIKRTPEITPQAVSRFDNTFDVDPDGVIVCTNCRFDLELINGKKIEFKSYGETSTRKIGGLNANSTFLKQHTAYLRDATTIDNIKYEFDINKLSGSYNVIIDGTTETLDGLDLIKYQFKKMYINNAADIIESMNPSILTALNISENATSFTAPQLEVIMASIIKLD